MFQDKLLYYPDTASIDEMVSGGLSPWPSVADFRGLLAEADSQVRATAIVFHGNAGHAGHRQFYADVLTRLGLQVILAEYPAYGPRGGSWAKKSGWRRRADHCAGPPDVRWAAADHRGIAGRRRCGGASVQQRAAITGLLLITPWDRMEHVAAHHYPLLPVKWLMRDHYDSTDHLASFGRPVLVAIAAQDSIVPPQFGKALYDALTEPRQLAVIKGADHNDWFGRIDEAWWRQAVDFLIGSQETG